MKILKIKFPKNFGNLVRQSMFQSKQINHTFEVHKNILYIDSSDLEQTEKIFNRIVLNFKII